VLRIALRVVLLVVIVYLAALRGYDQRGLLLLLVAVLWALALPFVLRGLIRHLDRTQITGWRRSALLVSAALVLLGAFAVGARLLIVLR
jgi:hypothetical protein